MNKLEDFLADFKGCILLVSHDRYFLDRLVDHLFVFKGAGEIKDFNGTYTEFRLQQDAQQKQEKVQYQEEKVKAKPKTEKPKTKLSFKEKYEFETLESEIEELENKKAELEQQLNDNSSDYEMATSISNELGGVITALNTKSDRWLELSEFAE